MNAANNRFDAAVTAALNRGGRGAGEGPAAVMRLVRGMPAPFVPAREASILYRVCATLYYAVTLGLLAAAAVIALHSGALWNAFPSPADALPVIGGALAVIAGCSFILLQGREMSLWFTVLLARGRSFAQPAAETLVMLGLGVGFCSWGGILLVSGL
ncbi:MAG: hypothetical protein ABIF71_07560 [Planctomycetota bacterium]